MARLALEGIRVVDFTWVLAGPFCTKILADHGAQVIKIESSQRPDVVRNYPPRRPGTSGLNAGGYHGNHNRNKLSMSLNMKRPEAQTIVKNLIKMSDVVVENYSVDVIDRMGLGYDVLKELNPGIVMVSMQGMGRTGPHKEYVSFGNTLEPLMGLTQISSFPNHAPAGTGTSLPDFIGALHGAFAILAALDYRHRTGKGQYIDLSQLESGASLLETLILDYTANGREGEAMGNHIPYAAPHGAYQCEGEERWITIAIFTEEEWKGFCEAIGHLPWTKDEKFATLASRLANQDELDLLISEWTKTRDAYTVMETMQRHGVASGVVQNTKDMLERDPQLAQRGFYGEVDHPITGKTKLEGIPIKLSDTPGSFRRAAPLLGQHTEHVLSEILKLPKEEIEKLKADEVLI